MIFVHQASAVLVLVTLTLVLQSVGMSALIQWAKAHLPRSVRRFGTLRGAVLMVRLTSLIVCLHMLQTLMWAWFYRWTCFTTWESAFYFSAASYSTVGASDLVLPRTWRTVGSVESVAGVLMCGVSASFLFAVVTRLVQRDSHAELEEELADSEPTLALTQAAEPAAQAWADREKMEVSTGDDVAVQHSGKVSKLP
jgi:voltage-gated potassium channel